MSTSKHIDRICIAVVIVSLIVTILFMNGKSLNIVAAQNNIGYENRLFDSEYVHKIDIVMDDWDSFIDNCESEEYSSCTIVIDGEQYKNTAIRAKGNTSLSNVKEMDSERYSFKVEFDHYQEGRTYYGLDKLCLNNIIQDNTMMKDYLVYQMMKDFGVDSPLCSYVYITVNGEDWGLYLAVESVENSFLNRNYGGETGELYKPDSMSFGAGKGNGKEFDMKEFENENPDMFNSDNNADSKEADNNTDAKDSSSSDTENSPADSRPEGAPGNMPGGFGGNPPANFDGNTSFDFGSNPPDFGGNPPADFGGGNGGPGGFGEGNGAPGGGNGGPGGFGGMGSSDVKLQYSDDDSDSYSNIFDNAKTDVSKADQKRLINSLKNLNEYTNLEETVDIDEVIRYFVVHNFVVNGDSYTGNMIHNYYLYEEDGILSMIPWDYNLAFGTFQGGSGSDSVNSSIDNPISGGTVDDRPMLGWIFSDEEYTQEYHELFAEFIDKWFSDGQLEQLITDTADMIRPYVEKDPTKFCSTEEFEAGVEAIKDFVTLRAEAVTRQLNGDTTTVDTGDLNTSDMGTMNNGGGGGFGPAQNGNGFGKPGDAPNEVPNEDSGSSQ